MIGVTHGRMLPAIALAAFVGVPSSATAGPHGGGHHGGGHHGGARASHGSVHHNRATRGQVSRPRVRDHRGAVRPHGSVPYVHHGQTYWPYYRYGYWPYYGYPYYGYYDRIYAPYVYGAPGTAEVVPPRPRARVGLAVHVGQLERDDDAVAGIAGISLRWRGPRLEGELELGRRVYADSDRRERSLAGNLYLNLGDIDAFHPYVLGGIGLLDSDRVFGAVGAGLALPVASRLTLAGDVRAASIGDRSHHDDRVARDQRASTVEGRLSLIVDF